MEVRSESVAVPVRSDKLPPAGGQVIQRTRLQVWFIRVCTSILVWTCLVQLVTVGELWHPRLLNGFSTRLNGSGTASFRVEESVQPPPPLPPASEFISLLKCLISLFCGLSRKKEKEKEKEKRRLGC